MLPAMEQPTITSAYRSVGITFDSLVFKSAVMRECLRLAASAAARDVAVLLLGETGTGKNLIAQSIHNASPRARGPFVSVNCSAIPDTLLEAELFGAEKGAYTSSDRLRKGKFELADKGTLFLDEIGDMSHVSQAKILRAFEYKEFERVGGESTLHADVRIIAATNRPLEELLQSGKFRTDLFYRLNEFTIHVPPLRARKEEIKALCDRFIAECNERFGTKIKNLDAEALSKLEGHNWPGNVRELQNVVRRAFILADEDLDAASLPLAGAEEMAVASLVTRVGTPIADMERRLILATLEQCGGDKKRAADTLKISLKTLYNRLNEYKAE